MRRDCQSHYVANNGVSLWLTARTDACGWKCYMTTCHILTRAYDTLSLDATFRVDMMEPDDSKMSRSFSYVLFPSNTICKAATCPCYQSYPPTLLSVHSMCLSANEQLNSSRSILILYSQVRLGLPSVFFSSGFFTKTLHAFPFSLL